MVPTEWESKLLCNKDSLNEAICRVQDLTTHGQSSSLATTSLYHLLQLCINKKDLDSGRKVHTLMKRNSYGLNSFLGSHLIRMYAQCGSLLEANEVFCKLPNPSPHAWSAVILAHAKLGGGRKVINLFFESPKVDKTLEEHVYLAVLKACSSLGALHEGKLVHHQLCEAKLDLRVTICNTLIHMYATCGCLNDSCPVFKRVPKASVVTWNAMIAGYSRHGYGVEALSLFQLMWEDGKLRPDNVTAIVTLKACTYVLALDQGKDVYAFILEEGLAFDVNIANAIMDMFAKCGSIDDAAWLFDRADDRDKVTWSTMIAGYVQHEQDMEALLLFKCMLKEGVQIDGITYASILRASFSYQDVDEGRLLHAYGILVDVEQDAHIGSTLIDMYAKSGHVEDANGVFERLVEHNVVTWGALMMGYAQHGYGEEVLNLFLLMKQQQIVPNCTILTSMLMACASVALSIEGNLIHRYVIISTHDTDATVSSALIHMYAKCGNLEDAIAVFSRVQKHSVGTWTALITGFAQSNDYVSAMELFYLMKREGLRPNHVTFASLLSACSRMGLADEGCFHFDSDAEQHAVLRTHEHRNCVIDLMGRTGRLNEAEVLLWTLPSQPDLLGWMSLLCHCKIHGKVNLGRQCFDNLVLLNEEHAAAYTLMASIYVDAGMMEEAKKIHELHASRLHWSGCKTVAL